MFDIKDKPRFIEPLCLAVTFSVVATGYLIPSYSVDTDTGTSNGTITFVDVTAEDISSAVDTVVTIPVSESESIRVGVTQPDDVVMLSVPQEAEITLSAELEQPNSPGDVSVTEVVALVDEVKAEIAEAERIAALKAKSYSETQTQGGLLDIQNPDSNYTSRAISITGNDRDILERLVMGEAGNQGFIGAALVAQTIKDLYYYGGFSSIEEVRVNCGFSGRLTTAPNQNVLDAVSYVFDQGGYAVKHRLFYFYAPKYSAGRFHETQNYILTYGGHKFFDRWY